MSSVFPASFSTASSTMLAVEKDATVIYTHTLKPNVAVFWAGCWCLIGTATSSGTVAFGIIALLPVELIVDAGSDTSFAMIFALLASAIIWNFGTWYFAIPASSSHTLIGAIIGVDLANSMLLKGTAFGDGVNWYQVKQVGLSLLISPAAGFAVAALLFLLLKLLVRRPELFRPAVGEAPPPVWIRSLLVLTCTGVSFSHGSNDGQKGMGLIMLILIGTVPTAYALNASVGGNAAQQFETASAKAVTVLGAYGSGVVPVADVRKLVTEYIQTKTLTDSTVPALRQLSSDITQSIAAYKSLASVPQDQVPNVRNDMYLTDEAIR